MLAVLVDSDRGSTVERLPIERRARSFVTDFLRPMDGKGEQSADADSASSTSKSAENNESSIDMQVLEQTDNTSGLSRKRGRDSREEGQEAKEMVAAPPLAASRRSELREERKQMDESIHQRFDGPIMDSALRQRLLLDQDQRLRFLLQEQATTSAFDQILLHRLSDIVGQQLIPSQASHEVGNVASQLQQQLLRRHGASSSQTMNPAGYLGRQRAPNSGGGGSTNASSASASFPPSFHPLRQHLPEPSFSAFSQHNANVQMQRELQALGRISASHPSLLEINALLLQQRGNELLSSSQESHSSNLGPEASNANLLLSRGHQRSEAPPTGDVAGRIAPPPRSALGPSGIPLTLPFPLSCPEDGESLSPHQAFLRQQIEAFRASGDEIATHKRGRNKPVVIGQVGIRCRHCAAVPIANRQKGSTYFPATLSGIYQAAQNMSTMHLQCGLCSEMPVAVKEHFTFLISTKSSSSGAGRPYWVQAATRLGLVDSKDDTGIQFIRDTRRDQSEEHERAKSPATTTTGSTTGASTDHS